MNSEPVKLTKELLMRLPQGVFLVSNTLMNSQPVFAEKVVSLRERQAQWKRIKLAKADGRNCHTFKTDQDYQKWRLQFGFPNAANN